MDHKPRLKDRLARLLWRPALLRSSTAAAAALRSGRLSAGESTRSFSAAADIAHEPIFISRSRAGEADELHFALLRRSLSLDHPASTPAVQGKEKKESRKYERNDFYETGELEEVDGKTCTLVSPSFESPGSSHLYYHWIKETESKKKRKKKKMMKQRQRSRSNRYQVSSISSSFGDEGFGLFSSEETDTFFSSRSFSSDSSEFYRRPSPKSRKNSSKTEMRKKKKHDESFNFSSRRRRPAAGRRDGETNGFQPLVSGPFSEQTEAEKNRREGFPVLKKSSDPYSDFRSSMVEMIVERQIFGARELERLLHSYLSLNAPEIHSAIFRAFADIAQVLFSY
ncbi:transcription repressor OFP8-like [Phalaenopsis equestris]|uniref:transcription repressor OFP8-like n=1 Tax=Phalaenopsis equestris TaxID=78828 RepID=UPI0009E4713A|nr:transcription repressor OFP8-like [Phalaenopsis equestris]